MTTLNQRAVELYKQAQEHWLHRSESLIERELILAATRGHREACIEFYKFPDRLFEENNLDLLAKSLEDQQGLRVVISRLNYYIAVKLND